MIKLYVLDVPEFRPVAEEAARSGAERRTVGDYVELTSDSTLTIDRRAAGARRAVWYSSVGALSGGKVAQFDSDALRIEHA